MSFIIQIAAAHQDSMIQQQFSLGLNVNQMVAPGVPLEMVMMPAPPPPPTIQPPDPTKVVPITPQEVINKMRARFYFFFQFTLSIKTTKHIDTHTHTCCIFQVYCYIQYNRYIII